MIRNIIAALFVMTALSAPAMAQDPSTLCKVMNAPKRAAGVSATYQAGVDVHGRPVVPADGGVGGAIAMPDVVRIPVSIELAQILGAAVPQGTDLQAVAGVVAVHMDGRVTYNGADITGTATQVCAQTTITTPDITANAPRQPAQLPSPHSEPTAPANAPSSGSLGTVTIPAQNVREEDVIWGAGE